MENNNTFLSGNIPLEKQKKLKKSIIQSMKS